MSESSSDASEIRSAGERSITRMIRILQQDPNSPVINDIIGRLYDSPEYRRAIYRVDHRVNAATGGAVSGEDVANDAFEGLLRKARRGQLSHLDDRWDLFGLFRLVIATKTRDALRSTRAQKRGSGARPRSLTGNATSAEVSGDMMDPIDCREPLPEETAIAREVLLRLADAIREEPRYRESLEIVLEGRIRGMTLRELAAELGNSATIAEVRARVLRLRAMTETLFTEDLQAADRECRDNSRTGPRS